MALFEPRPERRVKPFAGSVEIRMYILNGNKSYNEIADLIGVRKDTISKFVKLGKTSLRTLKALCNLYGFDLDPKEEQSFFRRGARTAPESLSIQYNEYMKQKEESYYNGFE